MIAPTRRVGSSRYRGVHARFHSPRSEDVVEWKDAWREAVERERESEPQFIRRVLPPDHLRTTQMVGRQAISREDGDERKFQVTVILTHPCAVLDSFFQDVAR